MSLLIKNGTVVNPAKKQNEVADVLVKDGKIAAIGQNLSAEGAEVYDATGLIVAPGLIDIHTHLREPGQEAKEDFHSGTQAAAAGGFTRVVTMANTNPVVDNAALVRGLQKQAELTGVVKVEFIGAVSKGLEGKELAEMGDMAEAGVVAFSDDGHYVENAAFMRRALEYSSMFNKMVIDHAEDITLTKNGHMHEGIVSYELGVIGRPAVAEDLAVARDILLSEMTGGHIHIAHKPHTNTVFRNKSKADPCFINGDRIHSCKLCSFSIVIKQGNRTALYRLKSCNCLQKFFLAASGNAGNTQNLSCIYCQINIIQSFYLFFIFTVQTFDY